jgi:hypothetical protein
MGRLLYRAVVRLHPRAFRERFGEEMIGIFDEATGFRERLDLFVDGLASLVRQRAFRPVLPPAPVLTTGGMFQSFGSDLPRRGALANGAVLSLILLGLLIFGIGKGGSHAPRYLIGAMYPRPNVLPVDRSSIAEGELTTEVKVVPPAVDPLYELANLYFGIIRVLNKLDADQDRVISQWEIVTSAGPLRRLDMDGDGALNALECGFSFGLRPVPRVSPAFEARARGDFMRAHPVLVALDADHDGQISAHEITKSSVALRGLDKNGDGSLSPAEVLPKAQREAAASSVD